MLTELALVLVLALFNGFFALSEMALVVSRKSRLKKMAKTSRGAAVALRHAEHPEYFKGPANGFPVVTVADNQFNLCLQP